MTEVKQLNAFQQDTHFGKLIQIYLEFNGMLSDMLSDSMIKKLRDESYPPEPGNHTHLFEGRYISQSKIILLPQNRKQISWKKNGKPVVHVVMDFVHLHLDLNHFNTPQCALNWLNTIQNDLIYQQIALEYKLFLQKLFKKKIQQFNSKIKNINKTYVLFIHVITHPSSPQIWREIAINGRTTMEQFDEILCQLLGFNRSHNYEFQFNLKNNKHFKNEIKNKKVLHNYIKKGVLKMTNLNIPNHVDRLIMELTLDGSVSLDLSEILLGQVLSLFDVKYKFNHKVPFDVFMKVHFPSFYRLYLDFQSAMQNKLDRKMRYNNFSYDRNDCFQWIYNIADDWRCNIYVKDIKDDRFTQTRWVKSLNGSGIGIPEDIGDFEDWYLFLLKVSDKYPYEIKDLTTKNEFYKWFTEHDTNKYFCETYLEPNGWNNKIFKTWMDKSKYPYFKPYNIMICEYLDNLMIERAINCFQENVCENLNRLRYNIYKNKKCEQCKTFKAKLKLCNLCKKVYYCSKHCQKISWNLQHRFHCKVN